MLGGAHDAGPALQPRHDLHQSPGVGRQVAEAGLGHERAEPAQLRSDRGQDGLATVSPVTHELCQGVWLLQEAGQLPHLLRGAVRQQGLHHAATRARGGRE